MLATAPCLLRLPPQFAIWLEIIMSYDFLRFYKKGVHVCVYKFMYMYRYVDTGFLIRIMPNVGFTKAIHTHLLPFISEYL